MGPTPALGIHPALAVREVAVTVTLELGPALLTQLLVCNTGQGLEGRGPGAAWGCLVRPVQSYASCLRSPRLPGPPLSWEPGRPGPGAPDVGPPSFSPVGIPALRGGSWEVSRLKGGGGSCGERVKGPAAGIAGGMKWHFGWQRGAEISPVWVYRRLGLSICRSELALAGHRIPASWRTRKPTGGPRPRGLAC